MKLRRVRINKIGSDAEFSFGIPDNNGRVSLVPAPHLIGDDKALRMESFIGTDGHANTAELRPAPCHNVYWHLMKIADGLNDVKHSMQNYEQRSLANQPLVAVAQPSLGAGETMGGHIWISMYYEDKLSFECINGLGMIYDNEMGTHNRSLNVIPNFPKKIGPIRLEQYRERAVLGDAQSLDEGWKKLHYLIQPLELMLYGAVRRDREEIKDLYVRLPNKGTHMKPGLIRQNWAYTVWEYRYPTTWLQDPVLALAYLGLAKLAILNWNNLPRLQELNAEMQAYKNVVGELRKENRVAFHRESLSKRLGKLQEHPNFRITRDLAGVLEAVQILKETTLRWPALINFNAWDKLVIPPEAQGA